LARNGRWTGKSAIPVSSVAGPSVIDSWMNGATRRRAANVMSRLTNSSACASAAGATMAAVSASARTNRRRFVSGLDRLRATGMMSRRSGRSAPIAWLMLSPRPANASPKPWRFVAAASEHVQELVELDGRGRGLGQRDRVAVLEALVGAAARELDVLEAQRGARPDDDRRVGRQRGDRALELQAEDRDARAVIAALDLDLVDGADARAPEPDLVPAHEVRRARHLGLERVGGNEREALVGVVGQEHGDEHDEHGRRADQHGVAGNAAAPAHQPSPPKR
jgi:hypothetical protein